MSLVYITYHNENIANIEKYLETDYMKTKRYKSEKSQGVRDLVKKPHVIDLGDGKRLLTNSLKYAHKTMGYAETPLSPPCAFLRKHQGITWRREREHVCPKGPGMPPVPRYERPKGEPKPPSAPIKKEPVIQTNCPHRRYFRNHKHRANFINVNIERMKGVQTKRPPPRYVDTPTGDTHNLLNTGLVPQHVCSKNFGKVPCYLRYQKKMLQKYQDSCKQEKETLEEKCMPYMNQYTNQSGLRKLTPEERQSILAGLKTNFAEIFKAYQSLSLYTDTMAKKLRKGKLEKDLRQLEQDIYLMEANPVIFISEY